MRKLRSQFYFPFAFAAVVVSGGCQHDSPATSKVDPTLEALKKINGLSLHIEEETPANALPSDLTKDSTYLFRSGPFLWLKTDVIETTGQKYVITTSLLTEDPIMAKAAATTAHKDQITTFKQMAEIEERAEAAITIIKQESIYEPGKENKFGTLYTMPIGKISSLSLEQLDAILRKPQLIPDVDKTIRSSLGLPPAPADSHNHFKGKQGTVRKPLNSPTSSQASLVA